jgi:hypothetical protein
MSQSRLSSLSRRHFLFATVAACGVSPAVVSAHHSFALYNQGGTTKIKGVVSRFSWTNPHVTIYIETNAPSRQQFKIETGSVNALKRTGWTSDSIKAGQSAEVTFNPLKSGDPGGLLVEFKAGDVVLTGGG